MALYHESRGESIKGQAGVGYTIINRTKRKEFPKTICEVIQQPGQFGFIKKHLIIKNKKEFEISKQIANKIINGEITNPIGFRLYFNTYQMFKTKYSPIKIGKHVFF